MPSFLSTSVDAALYEEGENRHLVARTHLLEQLTAHAKLPIRALIAPSGSGKTTLLRQYFQQHPSNCLWISLKPEDTSACNFFSNLSNTISQRYPAVKSAVLCYEFSNEAPLLFFDLFQQELNQLKSPITIILDDMQFLEQTSWHSQLLLFMTQSHNLNWIVAAQSRALLEKLPNHQSTNIKVISHEDLYFSIREIQKFLSPHSDDQKLHDQVMSITSGWPTGVKLSHLYLTRFPSDQINLDITGRRLFVSMVDHLLDDLSPEAQRFLTELAFLERFNKDLASFCVRGIDTTRAIEELLETRFLLEIRPEHALHCSFPKLVKERALLRFKQLNADHQDQLIGRACTWLTKADFRLDGCKAAQHHSQANFLKEYFFQNLISWLRVGNLNAVHQSVTNFEFPSVPAELMQTTQARTAKCWMLALTGHLKEAKYELEQLLTETTFNKVLTDPKEATEANFAVIFGLIQYQRGALTGSELLQLKQLLKHPKMYTSLRTTLQCILGKIELNLSHTGSAAEYLQQSKSLAEQLNYEFTFGVASQAEVQQRYLSGEPELAMQLSETFQSHAQPTGNLGETIGVAINSFLIYHLKDKLSGYEQSLSICGKTSPWLLTDEQFATYQPVIRYTIEQGEEQLADNLLQYLQQVAKHSDSPRFFAQIALERFRLALILGDKLRLDRLIKEFELPTKAQACISQDCTLDWCCRESWLLCNIYVQLGKHNFAEAYALNKQLLYLNVEFGYPIRHLPLSLLNALLEFHLDQKTAAYLKLNDVLTQAGPEGINHGLFDDIPGVEVLINEALTEHRIDKPRFRKALSRLGFGAQLSLF